MNNPEVVEHQIAVAPAAPQQTSATIFGTSQAFDLAIKQAEWISKSTLVPEDFQGNPANCLIALELSNRLNLPAFLIIQELAIIHGRPSFKSTFIIAQINSSGRYAEPLQFKFEGEGDARQCIAYTIDKKGVIQEGPPVSIKMAKAEGWYSRKNKKGQVISKWPNMPDLMLTYRAAAFFGRTKTPELTLGMQTYEELQDVPTPPIKDVTPKPDINQEIANARRKDTHTASQPEAEPEGNGTDNVGDKEPGGKLGEGDTGERAPSVEPKAEAPKTADVIDLLSKADTEERVNKIYNRAMSYDPPEDEADSITKAKEFRIAQIKAAKGK